MNRSHRLSQGAKKVTPPSIPSFSNPRGSGSSFGSDLSYSEREDSNVSNHPMSTFSRAPNGESSSSSPGKKKNNRIIEKMNCKESTIFFVNLAYISHINIWSIKIRITSNLSVTLWIFLENIIAWAPSILHFKGLGMKNLE